MNKNKKQNKSAVFHAEKAFESYLFKPSEVMDICRKAYISYDKLHPDQSVGNLLALHTAFNLLHDVLGDEQYSWVFDAGRKLTEDRMKDGKAISKGKGKNERARYLTYYHNYLCYEAVLKASEKGKKGEERYVEAYHLVKNQTNKTSPESVKGAYYWVRKKLKTEDEKNIFIQFPHTSTEWIVKKEK